ncbi:hypothetical protein M153_3700005851 [Pseudoloma neurophilia]|uniref:Zinc-ribbon 15 domain-containing protein n=1 Tax=Pseudoloma neurophilia TaxID=146866 RepID=A0A0R0M1Z0_9MICR|nr:hypothetical protein M153_3700005851 [Pseudoloma neurophilia]
MCHYVICGCTTKYKQKSLQPPVQNVYCPVCSNNVEAVEIFKKMYCSFFFIPICPVSKNKLYNGCPVCKSKFSQGEVKYCGNCRNVILSDYRFCGKCGDQVNIYEQPRQQRP